jgi:hypothetical protein
MRNKVAGWRVSIKGTSGGCKSHRRFRKFAARAETSMSGSRDVSAIPVDPNTDRGYDRNTPRFSILTSAEVFYTLRQSPRVHTAGSIGIMIRNSAVVFSQTIMNILCQD